MQTPTYNYIIAYDLNQPGQNYNRLHDAIVQMSTWYASLQKSLFFISTSSPSRHDVYNFLRANMDRNDTLCVIEFTGATLDVLTSLRNDIQAVIDTGLPTETTLRRLAG